LATPVPVPIKFSVYFPNDVTTLGEIILLGYENGLNNDYNNGNNTVGTTPVQEPGEGFGIGNVQGQVTPPKDNNGNPIPNAPFTIYYDGYNYGLNSKSIVIDEVSYSGFSDPNLVIALKPYMDSKCKYCKIKISAFASVQGDKDSNEKLAQDRGKSIYNYL
jgi:hypothetical protein